MMPEDTAPQTPTQEPAAAPVAPAPAPAPAHISYQSNPFALIRPSWEGFKLNWKSYLGLFGMILALVVVFALVLVVIIMALANSPLTFLLILVALLAFLYFVTIYITPATVRVQLAMAHHQPITLRAALHDTASIGWRLLWTNFLAILAITGGIILFIIPGILFAVWFSQVNFVVVQEQLSGPAALRRSRQLVRGRFWDVTGVLAMVQSSNLTAVVPVLGTLVSIAIAIVLVPAPAIRYHQLVQLKAAGDTPLPPTSPLNFVAIILAAIALSLTTSQSMTNYKAALPKTPVENSSQLY